MKIRQCFWFTLLFSSFFLNGMTPSLSQVSLGPQPSLEDYHIKTIEEEYRDPQTAYEEALVAHREKQATLRLREILQLEPEFIKTYEELGKKTYLEEIAKNIRQITNKETISRLLFNAIRARHAAVVQALFDQKKATNQTSCGNVFYKDSSGKRRPQKIIPIDLAVLGGYLPLIKVLCQYHAPIGHVSHLLGGRTPVEYALYVLKDAALLPERKASTWGILEDLFSMQGDNKNLSLVRGYCLGGNAGKLALFLQGDNPFLKTQGQSLLQEVLCERMKPLQRIGVIALLHEHGVSFERVAGVINMQAYSEQSLGKALKRFQNYNTSQSGSSLGQLTGQSIVRKARPLERSKSSIISLPKAQEEPDISKPLQAALDEKDAAQFFYLVLLGVPVTDSVITEFSLKFKKNRGLAKKGYSLLLNIQKAFSYKQRQQYVSEIKALLGSYVRSNKKVSGTSGKSSKLPRRLSSKFFKRASSENTRSSSESDGPKICVGKTKSSRSLAAIKQRRGDQSFYRSSSSSLSKSTESSSEESSSDGEEEVAFTALQSGHQASDATSLRIQQPTIVKTSPSPSKTIIPERSQPFEEIRRKFNTSKSNPILAKITSAEPLLRRSCDIPRKNSADQDSKN